MSRQRRAFTKCRGTSCATPAPAANRTPNGCYCDAHYAAWLANRQRHEVHSAYSGDPIWRSPQLARMAREAEPMTQERWERMKSEFTENARKWFAYNKESAGRKRTSGPSRAGTAGGAWISLRAE